MHTRIKSNSSRLVDINMRSNITNQFIAWLKVQGGAYRLGNGGLRLGRKLAGDHNVFESKNLRNSHMVRKFLVQGKRRMAEPGRQVGGN